MTENPQIGSDSAGAGKFDFELLSDEIVDVTIRLRGADTARIVAEMARLRPRAQRISDPVWRRRALHQVDRLPTMLGANKAAGSLHVRKAETLVLRGVQLDGSLDYRLAQLRLFRARID